MTSDHTPLLGKCGVSCCRSCLSTDVVGIELLGQTVEIIYNIVFWFYSRWCLVAAVPLIVIISRNRKQKNRSDAAMGGGGGGRNVRFESLMIVRSPLKSDMFCLRLITSCLVVIRFLKAITNNE